MNYSLFPFSYLIVEQRSAAIGGQVDVGKAIIIVVAYRAAQEWTGEPIQPGLVSDLGEMAVSIAFVESEFGADEENIQVAVLIVVQEGAAVADGL